MQSNIFAGAQEQQIVSGPNVLHPSMEMQQPMSGYMYSQQPQQQYMYAQNGQLVQAPYQPMQPMQGGYMVPMHQPMTQGYAPMQQVMQQPVQLGSTMNNSTFNQSINLFNQANNSIITDRGLKKPMTLVNPDEEISFVENIFLFCWALVSNVKEYIIESTVDLYEQLFSARTSRNLENIRRKQRKRAFFRRIKMEMGIPVKRKSRKANLLNLSAISHQSAGEEIQSGNKLEALEQELMFLKQQFSLAQPENEKSKILSLADLDKKPHSNKKARKSTKRTITVDKENRVLFDSPDRPQLAPPTSSITISSSAPPPPPLPNFSSVGKNTSIPPPPPLSGLDAKAPAAPKQANIPPPPPAPKESLPLQEKPITSVFGNNFAQLLKEKQQTLRKTSALPKAAPKKQKEPQYAFHHELFAAIQKKFKNMNEGITNNDSESESESEVDDTWTPPKQRAAAPKVPLRH